MDYLQDSSRCNFLLRALSHTADTEQIWPHVITVDKKLRICSIHRLISPLWERQYLRGADGLDLEFLSPFESPSVAEWETTTVRRINIRLLMARFDFEKALDRFHTEWPHLQHCTALCDEFLTWLLMANPGEQG